MAAELEIRHGHVPLESPDSSLLKSASAFLSNTFDTGDTTYGLRCPKSSSVLCTRKPNARISAIWRRVQPCGNETNHSITLESSSWRCSDFSLAIETRMGRVGGSKIRSDGATTSR